MDIVLAKSSGFCFGVKRAVNSVYDEIENIIQEYIPMAPLSTMSRLYRIWNQRV